MSRCSPRSGLVKNALTFDVEEYFHAEAFARVLRPEEWPTLESRVVASTERILDVLDRESSRYADDIGNGDCVRPLESILDRLVEEPSGDEEGENRTEPGDQRPERAAALRRLVVRRLGTPCDLGHGGRVARVPAGQHHCRGLGRLCSDLAAARDRLEIGVHRGGRLVPVRRFLRERSHDDEVEVVGHVGT